MIPSTLAMNFSTSALSGASIQESVRTLGDILDIFRDVPAAQRLARQTLVYKVQSFLPVPEGTVGGLFWGSTVVYPGQVGDEYFMTKGHFHSISDRAEYYITTGGEGALILMDRDRRTRYAVMRPSSVHYIPGHTAHRVANTGSTALYFFACWPSDAGHDYEAILREGFSARLRCVDGRPALIPEAS